MAQKLPPPWEWDKESPPPERKNEWIRWMTPVRPPSTPTPDRWKNGGFRERDVRTERREREKERHVVERGKMKRRMREDSEWERLVQVRAIYSLNLGFYSRVGWWFKNNIKEISIDVWLIFPKFSLQKYEFTGEGKSKFKFFKFFLFLSFEIVKNLRLSVITKKQPTLFYCR